MIELRISRDLTTSILNAAKEDIAECLDIAEQSIPKTRMGAFKRVFYNNLENKLDSDGIIAFKYIDEIAKKIVEDGGYEWQGDEEEEEESSEDDITDDIEE